MVSENHPPSLIDHQTLLSWCRRLGFPEEGIDALAEVAASVLQDEAMLAIFNQFHQSTILDGNWHKDWSPLAFDPVVQERYANRTSLFYLLAYLNALPHAEAEYRRRGIDLAIFDETMRDITTWYVHEHDSKGAWAFRQFTWIGAHLSCKLYRLGRMQYMLRPFHWGVHAYRNTGDGQVCILADPDLPLRADGYALGAGDAGADPDDGWCPVYGEREDGWLGHPVSVIGQVQTQPVLLSRNEWEPALQHGDAILDLHIPRGGAFDPPTLADSLRQAETFFVRFFPEQAYKALHCHTWMFSPQLRQILPPQSNIIRFQERFHLFPHKGSRAFLWDYVFGERWPDPAGAPRDSSLRRAVLDWIDQGGEFFDLPGISFRNADSWERN